VHTTGAAVGFLPRERADADGRLTRAGVVRRETRQHGGRRGRVNASAVVLVVLVVVGRLQHGQAGRVGRADGRTVRHGQRLQRDAAGLLRSGAAAAVVTKPAGSGAAIYARQTNTQSVNKRKPPGTATRQISRRRRVR